MLTRKLFRSKKAISPILATLLLIVIAVAAIVVTYAWITMYMGSTTQQAGFIPYKANVAFPETDTITIDIGNSGTSSGQIVQVYIGESASTATSQTTDPATISIEPNTVTSFSVEYDWSAGETYYFKIVPNSGAALSFTEQAPQQP